MVATTVRTLRVDDATWTAWERLARDRGTTITALVLEAMRRHLLPEGETAELRGEVWSRNQALLEIRGRVDDELSPVIDRRRWRVAPAKKRR